MRSKGSDLLRFLDFGEAQKNAAKMGTRLLPHRQGTEHSRFSCFSFFGQSSRECDFVMAGFVRSVVSKKKKRFVEDGFDLDLTYITPRIIAMGFPSSGMEGIYRNPLPEVQRFFAKRHAGHYKVLEISLSSIVDAFFVDL
jgi:hypothetical protein